MKENNQQRPSAVLPEISTRWVLLLMAAMVFAMFADVLLLAPGRVLSRQGNDIFNYFYHWRHFAFGELSQGRLPLWNPHLFSGAPFFGNFQSALVYPPNLLFLILPLPAAINWSIALHVFLTGVFTFLWIKNRGLHSLAAFLSGSMVMFGGPFFLHVNAGHLSNICTMAWAPLLFLAIDLIVARPSCGPCLLGAFTVAMAILAGHPQYVFYLAVTAGLYSLLALIQASSRLKVVLALALICLGGAALSAVQLLTAFSEASENIRTAGLPRDFAAMFSLPPENFLTLVAPWFFGDFRDHPYWGRCYLFEMSFFLGLTGLSLAAYGGFNGEKSLRRNTLILLAILLLLALGVHTPLFNFFYACLPGFNKFRGLGKFIFFASLFFSLLAGIGFDHLLKRGRGSLLFPVSIAALGVGLAFLALVFHHLASIPGPSAFWPRTLHTVLATGEVFQQTGLPGTEIYSDPNFISQASLQAWRSFLPGSILCLVLATLLFMVRFSSRWFYAVLLLTATELFIFGRNSVSSFDPATTANPAVAKLAAEDPGDYRIINALNPNADLIYGANDLWGRDPSCLARYAQLVAVSQGGNPDQVTQNTQINEDKPIFGLLRRKYIVTVSDGKFATYRLTNDLPHLLLVNRYQVIKEPGQILSVLTNTAFDPRAQVILESSPSPEPQVSAEPEAAHLVDSTTDSLTIEANLKTPAILLITDSYSRHWQVDAPGGAPQAAYQVLPADYCLRAIPLAAGHHFFQLKYSPWGFRVGAWISLLSLILFGACLDDWARKNFPIWPRPFSKTPVRS